LCHIPISSTTDFINVITVDHVIRPAD